MSDYNIKISQLDPVTPNPPFTEDFFPLVHSASMTTYRATIQDIGSLITHSISASYADTSSYSISSSYARTASYAISASNARTASFALNAAPTISASWASRSIWSTIADSALYASRSHDALYATRALDVDTHGYIYNFPWWVSDTPGAGNGNLRGTRSPLSLPTDEYNWGGGWREYMGPIVCDSGSSLTLYSASVPMKSYGPDKYFTQYSYSRHNPEANMIDKGYGPGGFQSFWPIASQTFAGTDQRYYNFWTASILYEPWITASNPYRFTSSYWSGSVGDASSGSWYDIPRGPLSAPMKNTFNGKWIRIYSYGANPGESYFPWKVSGHASKGEMASPFQDIGGLIRIQINSSVGPGVDGIQRTNSNQIIYLFVQAGVWSTSCVATVLSTNNYGYQLIKSIRLYYSSGTTSGIPGVVGKDPWIAMDLLLDNFNDGDDIMTLNLKSWGGVRFLDTLNVGPWPFENAGANLRELIFPVAPGHYDATSPTYRRLSYYIQGTPVVINPTLNEMTCSGLHDASLASPYSLHVSGTINTNTVYSCDAHPGLTTKITAGGINMYFSGGILIRKEPPDTYVPPVIPTSKDMVVIQICNSNSADDDEYNVYLNGNYIGYYDGGDNTVMNSVFYGNNTDTVNVASLNALSLGCTGATALANRTYYSFPSSYLVNGNNVLTMISVVHTGGSSDYGSVTVVKTSLLSGNVTLNSVKLSTFYNGPTEASFTFNFTWP